MTDTISRVPMSHIVESGTRDTCPEMGDSERDRSGTRRPNSIAQQALAGVAGGTPSGTPAGRRCPGAHQSRGDRWDNAVLKFGSWPRLMRARTAAAYCDERSVEAFLRSVGSIYPEPVKVAGKGGRWLRRIWTPQSRGSQESSRLSSTLRQCSVGNEACRLAPLYDWQTARCRCGRLLLEPTGPRHAQRICNPTGSARQPLCVRH